MKFNTKFYEGIWFEYFGHKKVKPTRKQIQILNFFSECAWIYFKEIMVVDKITPSVHDYEIKLYENYETGFFKVLVNNYSDRQETICFTDILLSKFITNEHALCKKYQTDINTVKIFAGIHRKLLTTHGFIQEDITMENFAKKCRGDSEKFYLHKNEYEIYFDNYIKVKNGKNKILAELFTGKLENEINKFFDCDNASHDFEGIWDKEGYYELGQPHHFEKDVDDDIMNLYVTVNISGYQLKSKNISEFKFKFKCEEFSIKLKINKVL